MANLKEIRNGNTKITLNDGVERTLKFDLNAMAELEDRYGSIDDAFAMLDKNSIKAVRFILWAGLVHEDPDLTEQKVGSLIDVQYLQSLMGTLGQAFKSDMPLEESDTPAVEDPNV